MIVDTGMLKKAYRLINMASKKPDYSDVELISNGYVEPGYDKDVPVALADWNKRSEWTGTEIKVLGNTMPRLAEKLEKIGIEIGWSDEWERCERCYRAVRIQPDSYHWQGFYWVSEDGVLCGDCLKDDPQDYLEYLDANERTAINDRIGIDLEQYGYQLHQGGFEHGLHVGMDDDPKQIAKKLRDSGIEHFIFQIDDTSQFYITFSVWVKEERMEEND